MKIFFFKLTQAIYGQAHPSEACQERKAVVNFRMWAINELFRLPLEVSIPLLRLFVHPRFVAFPKSAVCNAVNASDSLRTLPRPGWLSSHSAFVLNVRAPDIYTNTHQNVHLGTLTLS